MINEDKIVENFDARLYYKYILIWIQIRIFLKMEKENDTATMLVPRNQRYKQLLQHQKIPTTTSQTIIVPCLARSFGFKTNQYQNHSDQLQGILQRKQFQKFIRKSNRIIDEELTNKSKKQKQPFFNIISSLLKLSICLGIVSFIVLSVIVYADFDAKTTDIILTISIVLILFSVLVASLCPIFLYRSKYEENNYQQRIKQRLLAFADQKNREFMQMGKSFLYWRYQPDFFWIQLNLDSRSKQSFDKHHRYSQLEQKKDDVQSPPMIQ